MSIKKNFLYSIFYQMLNFILPLITAPYISRVIGLEGVGIFSYTNSIAQYFILFSILGLNNYGNRAISRVRNNKARMSSVFWNIYALQFITALISLILYVVIVFNTIPDSYRVFAAIQILLVGSAMFDINWFFFGIEKFKLTIVRNSIIKLITFFSMFIFVKNEDDLSSYIFLVAFSTLISQCILWFFIKKEIFIIKPNLKEIISHIKPNFILFIPVISISIYRILDKIMLGFFSGIEQTALYDSADKIVTIPLGIFAALGNVMLPRMSNIIVDEQNGESNRYIRDSMQFVVFLSIAMMFGLIAISYRFAPIYFGESFVESGKLIAGLAPIVLFSSWTSVIRTQYLIPRGKDRDYILSVIIGAIINIVINLTLIPRYGALGAVVGTLVAEATVMVYQTYVVRKELDIKKFINDSWIFLIPGLMMFFLLKLSDLIISNSWSGLIIQILLGISIYSVTSYYIFRLWNEERLNYFIETIGLKKQIKKFLN